MLKNDTELKPRHGPSTYLLIFNNHFKPEGGPHIKDNTTKAEFSPFHST